jgi:hypothetical protein
MKKFIIISLLVFTYFTLWSKPLALKVYGFQVPEISQDTNFKEYILVNSHGCSAAIIVGADMIAVGVTADEFDKIQFVQKDQEWSVESDSLPLPVNIRNVSSIYLYDSSSLTDVKKDTSFQQLRDTADFLGQAEKNGYIIWKYHIPQGANK